MTTTRPRTTAGMVPPKAADGPVGTSGEAFGVTPSPEQDPSPVGTLNQWLLSDEFIDDLISQTGEDGVSLTGKDGFLPELVHRVLERGLAVELTDHLSGQALITATTASRNR